MKLTLHGEGRESSGVTLVEVLVALAILAFVALGITSLLGIAMKQNKLALERSVATGLASGRLNQLLTMPYRSSVELAEYRLPGEILDPGPPATIQSPPDGIPGYPDYQRRLTFDYDTPVTGMLRVEVEVEWWSLAQGETKQHTMITYLHPALEGVQ